MKKIFINRIGRRKFLKTSLSGLALATLPGISFAQSNPDVVVIGAGAAGLSASAELMRRGISFVCIEGMNSCLLYTSPSPRDGLLSRMPSSA